MNCLSCGKPLHGEEKKSGWHKRCIKVFFGTEEIPEIEIDDDFINSVETNRYLVLGYDCTECGQKQNIVDENDIYGIEII